MDDQNFLLKQKEDSLTDSNTDNSHRYRNLQIISLNI